MRVRFSVARCCCDSGAFTPGEDCSICGGTNQTPSQYQVEISGVVNYVPGSPPQAVKDWARNWFNDTHVLTQLSPCEWFKQGSEFIGEQFWTTFIKLNLIQTPSEKIARLRLTFESEIYNSAVYEEVYPNEGSTPMSCPDGFTVAYDFQNQGFAAAVTFPDPVNGFTLDAV